MKLQRVRDAIASRWQPIVLFGLLFIALGGLLFYRINTLLPGYAPSEVLTYTSSDQARQIFDHPANAPFSTLTYGFIFLGKFFGHSLLATRVTATIFALITLAAFCWLVNYWFGRRTAILGTLLLGTSAWFLHIGRFGAPEVLLFGLFTLFACGVWLKQTSNPVALLLCFLITGALLYVPGMIWFVLLGVFWQLRTVDRIFQRHLWVATAGALISCAAIAPIGWAIYKTPELWKTFAGLPQDGWPTVASVLHNAASIPLDLFVRFRPPSPEIWLGRLPILDALAIAMLLLGVFVCVRRFRLHRVMLLAAVLVLALPLIAAGGNVTITIIIPFLYLLIAIGLDHFVDRWFTVFPRNPIARVLGVALISLAVIASCSYQLRHYFIAWPSNGDTRSVYTVPEAPTSGTIKR